MLTIGIDLGGTNIAAGLVEENRRMLIKRSVPTALPRSAEEILSEIGLLCRRICEEAGVPFEAVASVGVGTPGVVSRGVVSRADNLGFRDLPLAEKLAALTGKPVTVRNDGNAAALGEWAAGAGRGCSSLVMVTLGTGVGGGIVIGGRIHEGFNGAAGEIGHITVRAGGRRCACGSRGCLEAYSSASALIRQTRLAIRRDPGGLLARLAPTPESVTGKTAFEAMRKGDPAAAALVGTFTEMLATGIANVIQLLQPEVVCLGGGMSREGEALLAPLRDKIESKSFAGAEGARTKIVAAALGNDAGIIGAAMPEIE